MARELQPVSNVVPFEEDPPRRDADGNPERLVVDLGGFEGPIDVLLQLARDQKVDITQLSILSLAEQYLEFVREARRLQTRSYAEPERWHLVPTYAAEVEGRLDPVLALLLGHLQQQLLHEVEPASGGPVLAPEQQFEGGAETRHEIGYARDLDRSGRQ